MKLSVIIPVFNEVSTLRRVVERVRAAWADAEIIVVDDGSTDGTRAVVEQIEKEGMVTACYHEVNLGKGAALRTGFARATGDILLVQDADFEYDPSDYPALVAPILSGEADVVFGSRFLRPGNSRMPLWLAAGNKALTLLCNLRCGLRLTDMETCYKAFRREVRDRIRLSADRFGFEPEFTIEVAARGFVIREVPIRYRARSYREGKKITWKDGVVALCILLGIRRFH